MKLFETPAIEVVKFAVEDVITVSGGAETTTEETYQMWDSTCTEGI